jgi:hypothetical protein
MSLNCEEEPSGDNDIDSSTIGQQIMEKKWQNRLKIFDEITQDQPVKRKASVVKPLIVESLFQIKMVECHRTAHETN